MGLRCGIVGLPNVGKSTLFNCLTKTCVGAANYPFCTIEPNVGIVPVFDDRLLEISKIANSEKIIYASVTFVDIAGLVKGSSCGAGLGNKFLSNIREMDAIAHVVRCFDNDNIIHVENVVDPVCDIETINTELAIFDLEILNNALEKAVKNRNKRTIEQYDILVDAIKRSISWLNNGGMLREIEFSKEELNVLKPYCLITLKPVFYVANVGEDMFSKEALSKEYLDKANEYIKSKGSPIIPCCISLESEIVCMEQNEKNEMLQSFGYESSGLYEMIKCGYDLLNLHSFFTAGQKESRAFTIPKESCVQEAAGVIHTDFKKGFICAEVISYADYISCGGAVGAKNAGKCKTQGRDYIVQDGDVLLIRFNV